MKIAQKLGLLVGSLLVAILATIVLLSAQVSTTSDGYQSLITNQIKQRDATRSLLVEFHAQVQGFQRILLLVSNAKDFARLKALYDVQSANVVALTNNLLTNMGPHDPVLRTSLNQFKAAHAEVDAQYKAALKAFVASGYTDIKGASAAVQGQEDTPNNLITKAVSYQQRTVDKLLVDQQSTVDSRLNIIYGFSALILLLALLGGILVIRGIVRPIRSLTAAALDAANNRFPQMVSEIETLPDDAPIPTLPKFDATTSDELSTLASAFNSLQKSAVELAVDQRRREKSRSETLVNLGQRNQSLLIRMHSYLTELKHGERHAEVLDKLSRLDRLTNRIRRNAESLLVLAGAKQTRTWSQSIAIEDVLQAALSEIEEYTRVTIHHVDPARVHGGVAADLTHLLAELLENATRFSPRVRQVLIVGRLTPSGYQFDIIDAGPGMSEKELEAANSRITHPDQRRLDTKALGQHVVGRIAAQRGFFVRLLPSVHTGITAQVLVPTTLLSYNDAPAAVPAPYPMLPTPRPQPRPDQVSASVVADAPQAPADRAPAPRAPAEEAADRPGRPIRSAQPDDLDDDTGDTGDTIGSNT